MKSLKLTKELQNFKTLLKYCPKSTHSAIQYRWCYLWKYNDSLLKAVVTYRNHPSIAAIKKFCNSKSHFSFKNDQKEQILKELNNVNSNKATQNTDISTKMIKENSDIFGNFIFSTLNCCINTYLYLSLLKRADITFVHKKDSKNAKNSYRPFSILWNISKLYERIMFKQIPEYFKSSFFF